MVAGSSGEKAFIKAAWSPLFLSLPPSLPPSLPQALASSLASEPSLAKARSTRLAMLAPDGQTPLHCAAAMNNMTALNLLLLAPETDCFAVDLQG